MSRWPASVSCVRSERIHRHLSLLAQLLLNLRQIIFGDAENHGDRLELRDHHKGVVLLACTILPGSTRRRPTRPSIGEVMWQ